VHEGFDEGHAYGSLRAGVSTIYRKPADGSGAEEMLVTNPDAAVGGIKGLLPSD